MLNEVARQPDAGRSESHGHGLSPAQSVNVVSTTAPTEDHPAQVYPAYVGQVELGGVPVLNVIADSGSCTSIAGHAVLGQYSAGAVRRVHTRTTVDVESVDGSTVVFDGQVEIELSIGHGKFKHVFDVLRGSPTTLLLGNDFLCAYKGIIMLGQSALIGQGATGHSLRTRAFQPWRSLGSTCSIRRCRSGTSPPPRAATCTPCLRGGRGPRSSQDEP